MGEVLHQCQCNRPTLDHGQMNHPVPVQAVPNVRHESVLFSSFQDESMATQNRSRPRPPLRNRRASSFTEGKMNFCSLAFPVAHSFLLQIQDDPSCQRLHFVDFDFRNSAFLPSCFANSARFAAAQTEIGTTKSVTEM